MGSPARAFFSNATVAPAAVGVWARNGGPSSPASSATVEIRRATEVPRKSFGLAPDLLCARNLQPSIDGQIDLRRIGL